MSHHRRRSGRNRWLVLIHNVHPDGPQYTSVKNAVQMVESGFAEWITFGKVLKIKPGHWERRLKRMEEEKQKASEADKTRGAGSS